MCQEAAAQLSSLADGDAVPLSAVLGRVLARVLAWQALYALRLGDVLLARRSLERARAWLDEGALTQDDGWIRRSYAPLHMERTLQQARGAHRSAALLLGDIDDLRRVNQVYGHAGGDAVLDGVIRIMREGSGESGVFGRWGGEEFVILLPNADERSAVAVADDIRRRVCDHVFSSADGRQIHVTVSVGIVLCPRDAADLFGLFAQADRAARRAKQMGKNRVCVHGNGAM
jgi:diguanylate cyclase (GGDEF)-like protein